MRICVISDLHYNYTSGNPKDRQNKALILDFLGQIRGKYDCLILAGDIFDLWYDWHYCIVKQYFPILVKLFEVRQSGCRIIHISGNHDFWFEDFLSEYLDIELMPEFFELQADGKKIYVCHGDTHTVNDMRYQFFRRLIRIPLVKKFFAVLHPDLALSIGNLMSRSSRARIAPDPLLKKKTAGLIDFATKLILQNRADIVVMGHTHNPQLLPIHDGFFANSGDWINHYSYVEIIDGDIRLEYFNNNKGETV
nr:UDP-2,3-diacylglucosamine hydrolase [Candidatus Cloacimonadota bacterium]